MLYRSLTLALALSIAAALWFFLRHGQRSPDPELSVAAPPAWVERISSQTRAGRPSFLFVVYDARRRDDFSFGRFGNQRGDTPFLAKLAEDAIHFDDAVSPGCWTVPVHASIFSGLSVCELGDDYYNPGVHSFPDGFLSLAEILKLAGYRTVAYADHPYFYNQSPRSSLVRGFDLFNVTADFERYASYTNVGTPAGQIERRDELHGLSTFSDLDIHEAVARFNLGQGRPMPRAGAGFDAASGVLFADLYPLFQRSDYFRRRYGDGFDRVVFRGRPTEPFLLFLNLHMSTLALPDPGLFQRWMLETLMLTADHKGVPLGPPGQNEAPVDWIDRAFRELGLGHAPFRSPRHVLKQAFDNRFYDACFRAVFEYLERHGLMRNTVTIVTSDHGLSFGEQGERTYLHAGARPHEYMTRVPLVLRFPTGSKLTRWHGRYSQPVSLTDLFSTVLELALGPDVFERELPVRGQSLVERLRRGAFEDVLVAEASLTPDTYSVQPSSAGYSKAVYAGDLKLILAPELWKVAENAWPIHARLDVSWPGQAKAPTREKLEEPLMLLYDLARDPHERRNLAAERAADVARLRDLAAGSWDCRPHPWRIARPEWDEESLKTLRALGYIHE
jgi:arylsulfatase A-like enzyme